MVLSFHAFLHGLFWPFASPGYCSCRALIKHEKKIGLDFWVLLDLSELALKFNWAWLKKRINFNGLRKEAYYKIKTKERKNKVT